LNQQVFLDALGFAQMKPVFKGYEEWAGVVGDGMTPVFDGEAELDATLDEVVTGADEVLAANQ
jgi:multiple sugar transport system substrate-binding protein